MRIKKYRHKRRASSVVLRRSDGTVRDLTDCVMDRAPRFQVASEPTGRNPQAADEKEDVAQRMLVRVAVGLGLLALLFFGMMTKPTREQFLDWIKGRQSGQPELKMT